MRLPRGTSPAPVLLQPHPGDHHGRSHDFRCNPRAARTDVLAAGYGERYACPPIVGAYVDARVSRIYGGTSEVMKELISRGL